jgi:hypothetical protein
MRVGDVGLGKGRLGKGRERANLQVTVSVYVVLWKGI